MESAQPGGRDPQQPGTPRRSAARSDRKRIVALAIIALIAIWLVAFIVSNSETVRVSLVLAHVSLSLIWVMIICAVLGAVLALAIPRLSRRRS
jgi:uncharacterized integral membrane protein